MNIYIQITELIRYLCRREFSTFGKPNREKSTERVMLHDNTCRKSIIWCLCLQYNCFGFFFKQTFSWKISNALSESFSLEAAMKSDIYRPKWDGGTSSGFESEASDIKWSKCRIPHRFVNTTILSDLLARSLKRSTQIHSFEGVHRQAGTRRNWGSLERWKNDYKLRKTCPGTCTVHRFQRIESSMKRFQKRHDTEQHIHSATPTFEYV